MLGEYLLVVVDYYSCYFEVVIVKLVILIRIIDVLEIMFFIYGIVIGLKIDKGV